MESQSRVSSVTKNSNFCSISPITIQNRGALIQCLHVRGKRVSDAKSGIKAQGPGISRFLIHFIYCSR